MDFRHVWAFVMVAQERSFTRASQRLHISQPPLTRPIRRLEDELGVTLFVRHRAGAEMTQEGRALLDRARTVNLAVSDFQDLCEVGQEPPSSCRQRRDRIGPVGGNQSNPRAPREAIS